MKKNVPSKVQKKGSKNIHSMKAKKPASDAIHLFSDSEVCEFYYPGICGKS